MEILKKELIQLIKDNDFTILPHIGMFELHYTKPYIDYKNEIIPAFKTFSFNPFVKLDVENKLFGEIQKLNGQELANIKANYERFLEQFQTEIEQKNVVKFENLGELKRNSDGQLAFTEYENIVETPAKTEVVNVNSEPDLNFSEQYETPVEDSETSEGSLGVSQEINLNHKKNKDIRGWSKLLLYIIPLILVIGGLIWMLFFKPKSSLPEVTKIENNSITDSTDVWRTNSNDSLKVTELNNSTDNQGKQGDLSTHKEELTNNSANEIEILISIGAFVEKDRRDNIAAYLKSHGLPIQVETKGKFYKVFMRANSKENAEKLAKKVENLTDLKPFYSKR